MNNTQITLEPRYPFVPMFANGLPQADFYVNGITAPVLISPRSASDDTRHEWTGYLKIMKRGTYFLSLDADSSISLSIPFKNVELTSEAKDLSVKPESVVLEQGYYWCQIVHEYHPALGSGQEFCIAVLSDKADVPDINSYLNPNVTPPDKEGEEVITLVNLYRDEEDEGTSSSSSEGGGFDFEFDPKSSSSSSSPTVPTKTPPPGSTTRPRDWNSRKPMPTAPVFPKPTTGSTVWKHSPKPGAL